MVLSLHNQRTMAVSRVALFLAALALIPTSPAQQTSASLSGVITDEQHAVIPGAKITLINQDQGTAAGERLSGADGSFRFPSLSPATYTLRVEAAGFKRFEQTDIKLFADDRTSLAEIALQVGAVTETLEVKAQAAQLETETAMRAGIVTGQQVVDLALNGRGYTDLTKTVAGVISSYNGQTASNNGSGLINVNGMRGTQNGLTLDGVNNMDTGNNSTQFAALNVDAVAEFKLIDNSQSAEYGRVAGATINIITKGGTKSFHGTGYWFHRNEGLNANNWRNNNDGIQRALYRYNYQGYNIGGPIFIPRKFNRNREKLFFFWGQEWENQLVPNSAHYVTVPTAAERTGDFSLTHDAGGTPVVIKDPLSGLPFPGNKIPQTRFNADGAKLLGMFPLPNLVGNPAYNYYSQPPDQFPRRQWILRGDYNISDKWRLFARAVRDNDDEYTHYGWGSPSAYNIPFGTSDFGHRARNAILNLTTVINPSMTNEFIFGPSWKVGYVVQTPVAPAFYRSTYGLSFQMPYPSADPLSMVPGLSFGGVPNPPSTAYNGLPFLNANATFEFTDNLSRMVGKHQFKAGIYIQRQRKNQNAYSSVEGQISFGRDANNPGDTNWAFSNALLGNFQSLQQYNTVLNGKYRFTNTEWYVSDSWKALRKLTIEYGMRFYIVQPQYEAGLQTSSFNPALWNPAQSAVLYREGVNAQGQAAAVNPLTGAFFPVAYVGGIVAGTGKVNNGAYVDGIAQAGVSDYPRGLIQSHNVQYAPRLGLAWQVTSKTVIRAGGGVYYDRFQGNPVYNMLTNPPLTLSPTQYYGNLSSVGSASQGVIFPSTIYGFSYDGHIPSIYNYNIGVQRQLPSQIALDVSYVGSISRHLLESYDVNRPGYGSAWLAQNQNPAVAPKFDGTTTLPVNVYRPYQGYGSITMTEFGANSNYNSLQISVNRRLVRGLQLGVAYTWSKALGDASSDTEVMSPVNFRQNNYAPLTFDRRQNFVLNYIYNTSPLAKGGNFLDNVIGRTVFNGWALSGITTFQTGAPLSVSYTTTALSGTALARAITGDETWVPRVAMTGQSAYASNQGMYSWVNAAAFAPAVKGSYGVDAPPQGYVYGPGINDWDISIFKNVALSTTETQRRIHLRLEMYNAPNHVQFNAVNTAIIFGANGQPTNLPTALGGGGGRYGFGAVTSARDPRIVQIAAKFYF